MSMLIYLEEPHVVHNLRYCCYRCGSTAVPSAGMVCVCSTAAYPLSARVNRARYGRDRIYTNIVNILIAINPYKPVPVYGNDVIEKYSGTRHCSSLASITLLINCGVYDL